MVKRYEEGKTWPVKIGIDIGSSTTKIVAFEGETYASAHGGQGRQPGGIPLWRISDRYLYENNLELSDVEGVYITGVGKQVCGESGI